MLDRREFLLLTAGSALTNTYVASAAVEHKRFKAVAFDAFPIFDPRPVAAMAELLFPQQGAALMNAWRIRQFDYQWLRVLSGQYVNFLQATKDSLVFAAKQMQLDLSAEKRQRLMTMWSELTVWPDVPAALETLRTSGLRLVFLSNMTAAALATGLNNAHIEHVFEAVLSTDQIRSYKPDPRAYQMAIDHLHLAREEILFVAFAGWDVAGAKWFGYPTYWLNRLGSPSEELGIVADVIGQTMSDLLQFVMKPAS